MLIRLQKFSYRFAEQVLNSNLTLKQEIESTLLDPLFNVALFSRPAFNAKLDEKFVALGWQRQPPVFDESDDAAAKMDFLKSRVGIEVEFGHASFLGIDLSRHIRT